MRTAALDETDLEQALLRRSVSDLTAGRHRCADCARTPLIGEHLHRYAGGRVVCELCRPLRREDPISSERVRSSEHGHAVRLTIRAA